MKHLLIDALSVRNLSGRHVLLGHVHELLSALSGEWKFSLLTHRDNAEIVGQVPDSVAHLLAEASEHWISRTRWGWRQFDRLARDQQVDLVFSPSGMLSPGCSMPQLVLAQNPWPMLAKERGVQALRLGLQREGFRRAQRRAWRMAFNSEYMRQLYSESFGPPAHPPIVAYQGISPALLESAEHDHDQRARAPQVLAVSVMARHKAIDVLVDAFSLLLREHSAARLILIGAWPEPEYRQEIEQQIRRLDLQPRVELLGHVDLAILHAHYRSARAFCLLSRCESFGIPAVEAQAAGTPTVVAAGTAAPEITGRGGLVVPQDDPRAAAEALSFLLDDNAKWTDYSRAARSNAERYRWAACSAPLVDSLREFAAQGRGQ